MPGRGVPLSADLHTRKAVSVRTIQDVKTHFLSPKQLGIYEFMAMNCSMLGPLLGYFFFGILSSVMMNFDSDIFLFLGFFPFLVVSFILTTVTGNTLSHSLGFV